MARGFRKLLFLGTVIGAAAGVYYYNKKKNEPSTVADTDTDDFDDFSAELGDEADTKTESFRDKERRYVNLAFDKAKSALDAAQRAVSRTETYFNDEILKDKTAPEPEVVAEADACNVQDVTTEAPADTQE